MVEGVLRDVTDDQVGVLPGLTALVGLHVADEELDERRLAGTVGTEDGDTGGERDLEGDVVELLDSLSGVLEADLAHLEQRLLLGLDTLEERGVRELELVVLLRLERVVRAGLRDSFHERLEVAAVTPELEAVEVEDVGDHVVQEAGIVRDDDGRAGLEAGEVVLEPGDVDNIQVVGRLIEQEDVSAEEHGAGERELHLPTTREGADRGLLALIGETDGRERLDDLLAGRLNTLVRDDELEDRGILLATVNVVLDVEGADLVGGREALDLAVDIYE